MISTSTLSTFALLLTAGSLASAAPVSSNSTVVVAEPAIASNWGPITSGASLAGPAFSDKVPAGAVDTRDLGVRDNADYTDVRRCPGGNWGGAKDCTFEPLKVYNRYLLQTQIYGDWFNQCGRSVAITNTVTAAVAIENSFTVTYGYTVGLESSGLSVGASESIAQGWSRTETITGWRAVTIAANHAGYLGIQKNFALAEGRIRIHFSKKRNGHWFWYSYGHNTAVPVFSSVTTYTGIQQNCPASKPSSGWTYTAGDHKWTMAGGYKTLPMLPPP